MRLSWDDYFMKIAETISLRSEDPHTKVGCVIVDEDNRIVSTGYNGTVSKYPNINWGLGNKTQKQYDSIIHSELNAILYARQSLKNCSLYCTLSPCKECIKTIAASGIKNVYYKESRITEEIMNFANNCGILLIEIK